jgi:hypothetical protein
MPFPYRHGPTLAWPGLGHDGKMAHRLIRLLGRGSVAISAIEQAPSMIDICRHLNTRIQSAYAGAERGLMRERIYSTIAASAVMFRAS